MEDSALSTNLIARVVHLSLNARGGAERLAVVTIKILNSMGIDVELATLDNPDMPLVQEAFGEDGRTEIKKISQLDMFENEKKSFDITINTHGDMLPFFKEEFTKKNYFVYCHYPIATSLIECADPSYSDILKNLYLNRILLERPDEHLDYARQAYRKMMLNSTVLTNSDFSRRAIFEEFGVDSIVLSPPVDVDTFRSACLWTDIRDNYLLVVSRLHPTKKIENAIRLSKLLKQNGIVKQVKIIGNLSPIDAAYHGYLTNLVRQYDLDDFVKFEVNVNFGRLIELMREAKVYFHPMPGEPFGISTVEAMSAGLVPVVPDTGGHTEFVPRKYQFHTLGEAAEVVATALDAPASERASMSHAMQKFSTANYFKKFRQIVNEVLAISRPTDTSNVILASNRNLSRQSTGAANTQATQNRQYV